MEWLSPAEAADQLGVSERHVRRLAADRRLVGRRVGSNWLISAESVRERARDEPVPGRPLSPSMAWAVLRAVDATMDRSLGPGEESGSSCLDAVFEALGDRRDRYRLRSLLSDPAPAEHWAKWLARRAEPQRVWIHPGILHRLRSDRRLRPGGAAAAAAVGLEGSAGELDRFYVDADDYDQVLVDYRARPAEDGQVVLMVVPPDVHDVMMGPPGHPVGAAAGLVDCLLSPDARERHLAREHLNQAARRLARSVGDHR